MIYIYSINTENFFTSIEHLINSIKVPFCAPRSFHKLSNRLSFLSLKTKLVFLRHSYRCRFKYKPVRVCFRYFNQLVQPGILLCLFRWNYRRVTIVCPTNKSYSIQINFLRKSSYFILLNFM